MGKKITIKSGQVPVEAELNDTKTADAVSNRFNGYTRAVGRDSLR